MIKDLLKWIYYFILFAMTAGGLYLLGYNYYTKGVIVLIISGFGVFLKVLYDIDKRE